MRVLVLSDTHLRDDLAKLPPEVWDELDRSDVVLHAGDVVTPHLLAALGERAPVHAVLGNNDLALVGELPDRIELELAGERYYAVMARTFADARPGDVILYEDSYRNMSVAINRGNAASMLHAGQGQPLRIRVLGPASGMR